MVVTVLGFADLFIKQCNYTFEICLFNSWLSKYWALKEKCLQGEGSKLVRQAEFAHLRSNKESPPKVGQRG